MANAINRRDDRGERPTPRRFGAPRNPSPLRDALVAARRSGQPAPVPADDLERLLARDDAFRACRAALDRLRDALVTDRALARAVEHDDELAERIEFAHRCVKEADHAGTD